MNFLLFMKNYSKFAPIIKKVLQDGTFKGKNILITGGGTGLGKTMASFYSNLGGNVIISSRKLNVIENTAQEIKDITNNKVHAFQLDVRDHNSVTNLKNNLIQNDLFPDIIVNNAAGNFISPTEKLSYNAWNTVLDIVLKGTIDITLEFGKEMINRNKGGTFLNISATYAQTGSSFVVPSSISKAGCDNLVKSLAPEWGKYGIRLLSIAPGPIFTEGAFSRLDPSGNFQKQITKKLPTGRLGEKEELANIVTFLTSDYANWMTGQIITFDGGEICSNSGEFNSLLSLSPSDWNNLQKKK